MVSNTQVKVSIAKKEKVQVYIHPLCSYMRSVISHQRNTGPPLLFSTFRCIVSIKCRRTMFPIMNNLETEENQSRRYQISINTYRPSNRSRIIFMISNLHYYQTAFAPTAKVTWDLTALPQYRFRNIQTRQVTGGAEA